MKSERRHELQHNDLDMEIGKSIEFFKKYGTRIAWAALVVVSAMVLIGVYRSGQAKQRTATLSEYQSIKAQLSSSDITFANASDTTDAAYRTLVSRLTDVIDEATLDYITAQACVDLGDLHAVRAGTQNTENCKDLQAKAASRYNEAIKKYSDNLVVVAKAQMGLARLAESNRDLDTARKMYEAILAVGELANYPIATMAKNSLKGLDEFPAQVIMVSTPPPSDTDVKPEVTSDSETPAG